MHLLYYSSYDSWHDKTEFLVLERATCSEFFGIKTDSKNVTVCTELLWKGDAECS
jgi:hypothetical protein